MSEEELEDIRFKKGLDLLKAMLDHLQSLSPEKRAQRSRLLRQRLREAEEEEGTGQ